MSLPVSFTSGRPKIKFHATSPLEEIREAKLPKNISIEGYNYSLIPNSIMPSSNRHDAKIIGMYDREDDLKKSIIREDGEIIATYNSVSGAVSVMAFKAIIVNSEDIYMLYGNELAEPGQQCIDSINLTTGEVKHSITCFDMSSGNTMEVWNYYNGRPALGYPDKIIVYIKDSNGNIIDVAMVDKDGRTRIDINPEEILSSCGVDSELSPKFVTNIKGEYYIPYDYTFSNTNYIGLIKTDCNKYEKPDASSVYRIWGIPGIEDDVIFRTYVVRPDGVLFNVNDGSYGVLYNGIVIGVQGPMFSIFDYDCGKPIIVLDNGGLDNEHIGVYSVNTSWIKDRWTGVISWPFFE